MKRVLPVVLALLLIFTLAGIGINHYLSNKDQQLFLKAAPADLAGQWQSQNMTIKLEASGDTLRFEGQDFVRDGPAPRYVEKKPETGLPRVLEYDGALLTLTIIDASNQRSRITFVRVK